MKVLKIGKNISSFSTYSCQPKTKNELFKTIRARISKEGPNCDLNDIDTSLITNMSELFVTQSSTETSATGMCHMLRICGECLLIQTLMVTSLNGMSLM